MNEDEFSRQVSDAMNFLKEKQVLYEREDHAYKPTKFFDFVFRAHLACLLNLDKEPVNFEKNVEFAVMQTLTHFGIDAKPEYMKFLHDIIRTMQSDETYKKVCEMMMK